MQLPLCPTVCAILESPRIWRANRTGPIGARARSVTRECRIDALARTRLRSLFYRTNQDICTLDVPVSSVRDPRATYIKARPLLPSPWRCPPAPLTMSRGYECDTQRPTNIIVLVVLLFPATISDCIQQTTSGQWKPASG